MDWIILALLVVFVAADAYLIYRTESLIKRVSTWEADTAPNVVSAIAEDLNRIRNTVQVLVGDAGAENPRPPLSGAKIGLWHRARAIERAKRGA